MDSLNKENTFLGLHILSLIIFIFFAFFGLNLDHVVPQDHIAFHLLSHRLLQPFQEFVLLQQLLGCHLNKTKVTLARLKRQVENI